MRQQQALVPGLGYLFVPRAEHDGGPEGTDGGVQRVRVHVRAHPVHRRHHFNRARKSTLTNKCDIYFYS